MDEAKIQEILATERKEKLRYQEKCKDIASFGAKINGLATMVMAVFTVLCATGGYDFEKNSLMTFISAGMTAIEGALTYSCIKEFIKVKHEQNILQNSL